MNLLLQTTFALVYVLVGMLLGEIARHAGQARRAAALRNTPEPPPVPPDDPQRDPNWCHSHGQMQPCDGCRR